MRTLFNLNLYTTSNCHLCELAYDLTRQLVDTPHIKLIEISDNDKLLNAYEAIIPVLQRIDTLAELKWPYTKQKLQEFLK